MEKGRKYTILYVDDEESNLNIFRNTFRREYIVLTAHSAKEGMEILSNQSVDLILTDQRMPDMDGVNFLKQTIDQFPELNRILITGYTDFDALKMAINEAKIFQYIQKPWREEQLRSIIDQALELYVLRQENEDLNNQLVEKNKQLKKINADLLEFDKQKMDFLSIISHEIRTPLNGIAGSVDLMKRDFGEDKSNSLTSLFTILETSVIRLEKFLLTAERITQLKSQVYPLQKVKITPKEMLDRIIQPSINKFSSKELLFKVEVNYNPSLLVDAELVTFAFNEIVDNACKQTPSGSTITLKTYNDNSSLVVEISDEGPGFSDKILTNAFKLFVSDKKVDQQRGLSLALVNNIMENHNGNILLSNKPEGGAKVSLHFFDI